MDIHNKEEYKDKIIDMVKNLQDTKSIEFIYFFLQKFLRDKST